MAALNESVARAKALCGEDGPADVHELPKAAKKTAARKSPGKKADRGRHLLTGFGEAWF
jgi:hypothetical protein